MGDDAQQPSGDGSPKPSDDYRVGYKHPPRHSQFKEGQKGNPRGRPRGARNMSSLVRESLEEKVAVREGGRTRKASKIEIGIKRLANKFAETGDPKALKTLMDHCPDLLSVDARRTLDAAAAETARLNEADLLAWYRARVIAEHIALSPGEVTP